MEDKKFKVIIVEDVKLELKGTEEIFRHSPFSYLLSLLDFFFYFFF